MTTSELVLKTLHPYRHGLTLQSLRAGVPGSKEELLAALEGLRAEGEVTLTAGIYRRVVGRVARYRARADYAGHIRRDYYASQAHHAVLKTTLKTLQGGPQ